MDPVGLLILGDGNAGILRSYCNRDYELWRNPMDGALFPQGVRLKISYVMELTTSEIQLQVKRSMAGSFVPNILLLCFGADALSDGLSPIVFHKKLMDGILASLQVSPDTHTIGYVSLWDRPSWGLGNDRVRKHILNGAVDLFHRLVNRDFDFVISPGSLVKDTPNAFAYLRPNTTCVSHLKTPIGPAHLLVNIFRDLGGHMGWLIEGTPLHKEWLSVISDARDQASQDPDLVEECLVWIEKFHDLPVKHDKEAKDNYSSLAWFHAFSRDREVSKVINDNFSECTGNLEVLRMLEKKYSQQEKGRRRSRRYRLLMNESGVSSNLNPKKENRSPSSSPMANKASVRASGPPKSKIVVPNVAVTVDSSERRVRQKFQSHSDDEDSDASVSGQKFVDDEDSSPRTPASNFTDHEESIPRTPDFRSSPEDHEESIPRTPDFRSSPEGSPSRSYSQSPFYQE